MNTFKAKPYCCTHQEWLDCIRSKSKKPGDRAIRLSNKLIMQAEILTNLFHLARTASKKNKKIYRFQGDL